MQKGTINVQTENILPIIKRYLYSDQEIFLRELISNAVDATQKLRTLSAKGITQGDLGDVTIQVSLDQEGRTLTIADRGIGMTAEEVQKYITEVAFSSAQEFVEKYDDANAVIGHFGLGFYSAFMVADKVEIKTLSYQEGATAAHWTNEGGVEYTLEEGDKAERGTEIILHINEDGEEYLKSSRISELLNKYCRFLPVPIQFGTRDEAVPKAADADTDSDNDAEQEMETIQVPNVVNDNDPIWTKHPNDLTDEDYRAFYRLLYPMEPAPLFWIHLNVDHPFQLTGILYFPVIKSNNFEVRKDRIHLYSNQVFVTDHVEEIVPDFLMLLHGVIDSPDIPLNVSRSYLQSDPEVKKINKYITRKVADKLDETFRKDRELFENNWENIGALIKYGMLTNEKFYDKAMKFCLFEDTNDKKYTYEELKEATKNSQTDKDSNLVQLYSTNLEEQFSYVRSATDAGYTVLKMDVMLDPHLMGSLENKKSEMRFKRVDADTLDKLIEKDETIESVLTEDQQKSVQELFTGVVSSEGAVVTVQALSPSEQPVLITKNEFMRRMKDMSNIGGANPYGEMPEMYNVVVNANHPVVSQLAGAGEHNDKTAEQLFSLALLQQNMLKGEALTNFINRSLDFMAKK